MAVDTAADLNEAPTHAAHGRSPVDVVRAAIGGVLLIGGVGVANVFDSTFLGLSEDGNSTLASLPVWVHDAPAAVLAAMVIAAVAGALGWALVTTRFRRFTMLTAAFVGAAALSIMVGEFIYDTVDASVRAAFDVDSAVGFLRPGESLRPGDPLFAGAVAMLATSESFLRRTITRRVTLVLGLYAAVSIWSAGVPALGLVNDLGAGMLIGAAILLILGRHRLAPNGHDITEGLASLGIDVIDIKPLDVDARGSAPWIATLRDNSRLFVKALGRDERSADLLFRAYRWVRLRKTGDHRPFVSLQRAVEHEALVALQAAALGTRTPRIIGVADAGIDGMVLAYEAIDGTSADQHDDLDDDTLDAIWSMVHGLHRRRIAHRDLRLANIFIASDGLPWMIDFGFAELAASDQMLGTDVAELLASTAAVVGADRAVAAAHRTSAVSELERAMPWLQPLALSSATREAIGGAKGLDPIRTLLIDQCGIPAEEPVQLQRISTKTLFVLATIGLSGWFLVPQLADIDNVWSQARDASKPWAIAAVGLSLLTYVAATASLLAAIPCRIPFGRSLLAQLASSFANRVTPAKVGGFAANIRYLQRNGVPTAVGITAVGLNAVAGLVMHLTLIVGFLLLASGDENTDVSIISPATIVTAVGVVVVILAVSFAIPLTRRLVTTHVVPQLRAGWASLKTIGRQPGRLLLLLGGSAGITLAYLAAMAASLQAFGSTAPLPIVGLLFLTGSAVAMAAPTPGGLGAAEAALIGALSTVEEASVVIPAVFLYRLVTFWLPILPGWLALTYLRRVDQI